MSRTLNAPALSVVVATNAIGTSVTQAYFAFPMLMMIVLPTARATAASNWLAIPNIGQIVLMLPDRLPFTEELFIKAMRTGKHIGTSREILPPMPWINYGKATDQDLKAIWAYLKSVPPVRNLVPDPVIAPPPPPPAK